MPQEKLSKLFGIRFVMSSGNSFVIRELPGALPEEDAVRVHWVTKPSKRDIQDFDKLMRRELGEDINVTICTDKTREAEKFAAWRKERK